MENGESGRLDCSTRLSRRPASFSQSKLLNTRFLAMVRSPSFATPVAVGFPGTKVGAQSLRVNAFPRFGHRPAVSSDPARVNRERLHRGTEPWVRKRLKSRGGAGGALASHRSGRRKARAGRRAGSRSVFRVASRPGVAGLAAGTEPPSSRSGRAAALESVSVGLSSPRNGSPRRRFAAQERQGTRPAGGPHRAGFGAGPGPGPSRSRAIAGGLGALQSEERGVCIGEPPVYAGRRHVHIGEHAWNTSREFKGLEPLHRSMRAYTPGPTTPWRRLSPFGMS